MLIVDQGRLSTRSGPPISGEADLRQRYLEVIVGKAGHGTGNGWRNLILHPLPCSPPRAEDDLRGPHR